MRKVAYFIPSAVMQLILLLHVVTVTAFIKIFHLLLTKKKNSCTLTDITNK